MNKIQLKLDEPNDLSFQFKIQGTSTEPGTKPPLFRFVLTQKSKPDEMGFVFSVKSKSDDGVVTIHIPALNSSVKEGIEYIGTIEVIVGTRLLTPTVLNVEFIKSFSVEVKPITKEANLAPDEILEELDSLLTAPSKPTNKSVVENEQNASKKLSLTKSQIQELLRERLEQKKVSTPVKSTDPMKNTLKDLMKGALLEE